MATKRLRRDPIGYSFTCFDGVKILSDTRLVVRDPIGYSLQRQPEDPTGYFVVVVDFVFRIVNLGQRVESWVFGFILYGGEIIRDIENCT